jgi:hypothetical protein
MSWCGAVARGWLGEIKSTLAKKLLLKSAHYIDLNNVTIPTPRGTTQIDHVMQCSPRDQCRLPGL